jgi:hypothetical protein
VTVGRIAILSLVVLASGCKASLEPDWDHPQWVREISQRGHGLFLGVVVDPREPGHPDGLRVQGVLAASPAADGGVQRGDVIVRLGAARIRSSDELAATLARESADPAWQAQRRSPEQRSEAKVNLEKIHDALSFPGYDVPAIADPRLEFELTVLRGEQEVVLPVRLTSGEVHAEKVVAHIKATARRKTALFLPFVIDSATLSVAREDWKAWLGVELRDDPALYVDIDILPLFVASLFRWEATPLDGWRRVTVGHWPAVVNWMGDPDERLDELSVVARGDRAIH